MIINSDKINHIIYTLSTFILTELFYLISFTEISYNNTRLKRSLKYNIYTSSSYNIVNSFQKPYVALGSWELSQKENHVEKYKKS